MDKTTKSMSYSLHWNRWNHKEASHISCIKMDEITKKYHIYFALKWTKPPKKHHIYLALKWTKPQKNIIYILLWNGWNHKEASLIFCIEMNKTTKKITYIYLALKWMKPQRSITYILHWNEQNHQKTSHISCTEMDETKKKHHIYFALKWMKPPKNFTYILHWNEQNHQKTKYILHWNRWNPKEASHIFDIKYLTLKCVEPQKEPHISCIEMHDTTRLLHMCHEPRPIAIEKIIFCTVVGSLNRSILDVCKWSLNWCWAGFLSFNIEKNWGFCW
jgi:hypothetical protein